MSSHVLSKIGVGSLLSLFSMLSSASEDPPTYLSGVCPNDESVLALEIIGGFLAGATVDGGTKCVPNQNDVYIKSWFAPGVDQERLLVRVPDDAKISISAIHKTDIPYLRVVEFRVIAEKKTYADSFVMRLSTTDRYTKRNGCANVLEAPSKYVFVWERCLDK